MKASWLLLALGIALEVAGTVCMKLADGFRDLRAATLMYVFYALSLTTLTFAFKRIDIGVGYAVWSGAGLALIATIGIVWFREPATTARLVFLTFILVGLLGLRLAAAPPLCSQSSQLQNPPGRKPGAGTPVPHGWRPGQPSTESRLP